MRKNVILECVHLARGYLALYLSGLLGGAIGDAATDLACALLLHKLFDAIASGDLANLRARLIVYGGATLIAAVIGASFNYLYSREAAEIIGNIRKNYFQKLLSLPIGKLSLHHSGDILSGLSNDIGALVLFYSSIPKALVTALFSGFAGIIYLYIIDYRLCLYTILMGISSVILNTRLAPRLRQLGSKVQEQLAILTRDYSDILSGMIIIRTFQLFDSVKKRFAKDNSALIRQSLRRVRARAELDVLNTFVMFASSVGIIGLASFLSMKGSVSVGAVMGALGAFGPVFRMFGNLNGVMHEAQASFAGADRVIDFLKQDSEPSEMNCEDQDKTSGYIEFRNVSFAYDQAEVLTGLSFQIHKGETVALVGPSGGGKSTVFRLMLGYYKPHAGTLFVGDYPVNTKKISDLRRHISVVLQNPYLFQGTIADNIALGRVGSSMSAVIEAATQACAHEFICSLENGYETLVGERGSQLSGGQRQRIAIARALLRDAPILLLDEATSSLDSESEVLVHQALQRLMVGRTTLVIAHRPTTIHRADRILLLEKGKIDLELSTEQHFAHSNAHFRNL